MGLFSRRSGRAERRQDRAAARRLRPTLDRLEVREMPAVYAISGTAQPRILRPNRAQAVEVRLRGFVSNNIEDMPTADFQVVDQYRQFEPTGPVALKRIFASPKKDNFVYSYDVKVKLPTKVNASTAPGRSFYILISAGDEQSGQGKYFAVLVPTNPGQFPVRVKRVARQA